MSLTIPASWQAAVGLSGAPRLVFLVTIWTAQAVTRKFLSAPHNTLTYPQCVADLTPYATELDPLERKIRHGGVDVTLERSAVTDALTVDHVLKGKRCRVQIGAPNLAEFDFVDFFTGIIQDALPDEGFLTLPLDPITRNLGRTWAWDSYLAKHPLEVILAALQDSTPANLIDSAAFAASAAAYVGISHFVVSRGVMFDGLDTREQKLPDTNQRIIEELCFLLQGSVLAREDGVTTFLLFNPGAAVVDTWEDGELGDVVVASVYDNALNRVTLQTHKPWGEGIEVKGEYQAVTSDEDGDAQTRAAYHDDTTSVDAVIERSWESSWLQAGTFFYNAVGGPVDWTAGDPTDGEYVTTLVTVHSFTGTRFPAFPGGAQPADAAVNSSRLLYCRVGSEIIAFDQVLFYDEYPREVGTMDLDDADTPGPPPASWTLRPGRIDLRLASGSRGSLGTTARAHTLTYQAGQHRKPLLDITMAVHCTETLVTRFRDGAPVVQVSTGLDKYGHQVGELVALVTDRIRWKDHDGVTAATKWEITRKAVLLTETPPRIDWTLVYASDSGSPVEAKVKAIRLRQGHGRLDAAGRALLDEVFVDRHVVSGFGYSDSGLDVTMEVGTASCHLGTVRALVERTFTLGATKETYFSFDLFGASYALYEQTIGTGSPADLSDQELLLWRFETDGSGVTTAEDLRAYRSLPGGRIYADAISTAHRDPRDSPGNNMLRNGEFATTSLPNVETATPPDGWEVFGSASWVSAGNGAYFDTTTVESADRAIRLKSGGTLTSFGVASSKFHPIEGSALVFADLAFYLSAVTAGAENLQLVVQYFGSAKTGAGSTAFGVALTGYAATTWHNVRNWDRAPSTARWFKVEAYIGSTAVTPDVYLDRVRVAPGLSQFRVTQDGATADQSVATGTTWVKLTVPDSELEDIGADYFDTIQRYVARTPGTYAFAAIFVFKAMATASKAQVGIGFNATTIEIEGAEIYNASGGAADVRVMVSGVLRTTAADQAIEAYGRHDHGSNRDVECIRFTGTQLEER